MTNTVPAPSSELQLIVPSKLSTTERQNDRPMPVPMPIGLVRIERQEDIAGHLRRHAWSAIAKHDLVALCVPVRKISEIRPLAGLLDGAKSILHEIE